MVSVQDMSKSQRVTGPICLEQATGRLLVAVVTVSRQDFGANATTLISALRHCYVSGYCLCFLQISIFIIIRCSAIEISGSVPKNGSSLKSPSK